MSCRNVSASRTCFQCCFWKPISAVAVEWLRVSISLDGYGREVGCKGSGGLHVHPWILSCVELQWENCNCGQGSTAVKGKVVMSSGVPRRPTQP